MRQCQLCNSERLQKIIDLGMHPLADHFLSKSELADQEKRFPLFVVLCEDCGHAMLGNWVSPEDRYQSHEYSYTASNSKASLAHFSELADVVGEYVHIKSGDLVIDIGSNDGTLLDFFREKFETDVLGVDPSPNIIKLAQERGVPTRLDFFTAKVGKEIGNHKKATAITSTNTFNHISDMDDFMGGIDAALSPTGVFVFEVPYFLDLIDQTAFDTIYLEHISYFSVKPFVRFFAQRGFHIQKLERTPYMGGSIRVFVGRSIPEEDPTRDFINKEESARVFDPSSYRALMEKINEFKVSLLNEIRNIKDGGGKIAGVGAATKGNTLLNYCAITNEMLEFVTDGSPLKIGKYTPGAHLPIVGDDELNDPTITHALILPWNIADLLVKKLARPGLSFIIPRVH
ncbi:MAG TPA: class I SAM-dependent methyltransferase [Candidatus Paceibacterota bacterium]|nr:class I SAM-dependent methyltransferase [Candidatus Paceibacterota bacterium]